MAGLQELAGLLLVWEESKDDYKYSLLKKEETGETFLCIASEGNPLVLRLEDIKPMLESIGMDQLFTLQK